MSVSSIASSCMGAYQSQTARSAAVASNAPVTLDDEAPKRVKSGCDRHGGGQQNTLAKAMMAALKALGVGQSAAATTTATTATTSVAATPSAASATTDAATKATAVDSRAESRDIEKAVHEFAHELFQALRGGGNGEQERGQGTGTNTNTDMDMGTMGITTIAPDVPVNTVGVTGTWRNVSGNWPRRWGHLLPVRRLPQPQLRRPRLPVLPRRPWQPARPQRPM